MQDMEIGQVVECWRYPVKSLQGEAVASLELGAEGVSGDRRFGIVDPDGQHVLSAKTVPELLTARAMTDHRTVVVTLPDGLSLAVDDGANAKASAALSEWLGRAVEIRPAASNVDGISYEMTFEPPDDEAALVPIETTPGTWKDLAPLHILTTAALATMSQHRPASNWDVRRFRPNLLVEPTGEAGSDVVEERWVDHRLRIGTAVVDIRMQTVRCAVPLRAQPGGIERDVDVYRTLDVHHANHLGVYAWVDEPGHVAVGDSVSLLD